MSEVQWTIMQNGLGMGWMEMMSRGERFAAIEELAAKRSACIAAADVAGLELGAAIDQYCQEFSMETADVAAGLMLGESAVAELRTLSRGKLTALDRDGAIPAITHSEIPAMIEQFGPVSRVIGHAGSGLVLYESGLGLSPFYPRGDRAGRQIFCEHMLMRFGNDAWLQIKGVQFGYGGMGPTRAHQALELAGLPADIADSVFYADGINLVVAEDGAVVERDFGEPPPGVPDLATDGTLVAVIDCNQCDDAGESALRSWLTYLDSNKTVWKSGPRRISLYPLHEDAVADGFSRARGHVPQLIVEQGDLQIWLAGPAEYDPGAWIPPVFRRYLEVLDVLPTNVVAHDDASPFRRWLSSHAHRRPRVIGFPEGNTVTRVPQLRGY